MTSPTSSHHAVITGIGCISPFGSGSSDVLARLLHAQTSAIGPVTAFPTNELSRHLGAEVPADAWAQTEEGRRWSRMSQMAVAACRHAVDEAGLSDMEALSPFGLVLGSEYGDLRSTETFDAGFLRRGPRGLSAFLFPNTVMNSMAGTVSIALGIKGPMLTLNQPGIAGELAVARAVALLAAGRAPAVIACGVDELCSVLYHALDMLNVPSPRGGGEEQCRPFDDQHNGPIMGEGATALVIETPEHAQARGATVFADIRQARWGGISTRPHHYPSPDQVHARLLKRIFKDAAVTSHDIDVAYLSGSGDPEHDAAELALMATAFSNGSPLLTSLTHLTGEYGSLGTLRVAAAALTTSSGRLPSLEYLNQAIRPELRFARQPSVPPPAQVLVHGLARGGSQAAILVGPASSSGLGGQPISI